MTIYQPYTYLIGWSKYNKFYYGVRYAVDCKPDDLWYIYYTSSSVVEEFRREFGEPDIIQIRKTFQNAEDAIKWESKILKRINAAKDPRFLNKHNNTAFTPLFGDDNVSKRPEVREKLSKAASMRAPMRPEHIEKMKYTIIKKNIVSFLKQEFTPKTPSRKIKKIQRYIDFIKIYYPNHVCILRALQNRLKECEAYNPIYPKNRKRGKRGRVVKISDYRNGKKWYTNSRGENVFCLPGSEPEGFKSGMTKKTPNNNTPDVRAKISESMKRSRENETIDQKQQRLKRYYDTIEKRKS